MVAVTMLLGGVFAIQAPAAAATRCYHSLDMYKNSVEVVATEDIWCDGPPYTLWARVQGTKPTVKSYNRSCDYDRTCSASVGWLNPAGSQQFCARAHGGYKLDYLELSFRKPRN